MPTIKIIWHTQHDDRVCKICRAIEGYTWELRVGQDSFPKVLTHPSLGPIWDVVTGSMAHGHKQFSCRCYLGSEFDLSDLIAKLKVIAEELGTSGRIGL